MIKTEVIEENERLKDQLKTSEAACTQMANEGVKLEAELKRILERERNFMKNIIAQSFITKRVTKRSENEPFHPHNRTPQMEETGFVTPNLDEGLSENKIDTNKIGRY